MYEKTRTVALSLMFFVVGFPVFAQTAPVKLDPAAIRMLDGHASAVLSVAATSDGSTGATGGNDRHVILWNTATGEERLRFKAADSGITALAFSAKGDRIVTGSRDKDIVLWSTADGKEVARFQNHKNPISALALSSNGRFLAFGLENGQAGIWDVKDEKPLHPLNEHSKTISAVAFSPDGARVALASQDRTVSVWNVENGKLQLVFKQNKAPVESVAFDAKGHRIISGSADRTAVIWNSRDGKELFKLEGHEGPVSFVAFAPDGNTVYTASRDKRFIQWNSWNGQAMVRCELDTPVVQATISGDAFETIVVGLDGKAFCFSTDAMQFVEPKKAAPATDPTPLAKIPQEKPLFRLDPTDKLVPDNTPKRNRAVFHPNGPFAVSAGDGNTGVAWDLEKREAVYTFSAPAPISALTFCSSGRYFAVGMKDGSVALYDPRSGKQVRSFRGHTAAVNDLAFFPDGSRLLSAGADRTIVLWNVESGRSQGSLLGHTGPVNGIVVLPDSSTAVSVSSDKTIRIWEGAGKTSRPQEYQSDAEKQSPLVSLALSPDGDRIAVGAEDKTITIIDLKTRQPVLTLPGSTDIPVALAYSSDGRCLASGGTDGRLVLWDAKTGTAIRTFPQISTDAEKKIAAEKQRTASKKWSREAAGTVRYESIRCVAFSKNGAMMLSSGGAETFFWKSGPFDAAPQEKSDAPGKSQAVISLPAGEELWHFDGGASPILDAVLSRDASKLVVSEASKRLTMFDVSTGKEIVQFTAKTPFNTIRLLQDDRTLLAGGEDGRFFSINTVVKKENFAQKVHTDRILSLACTPGGTKAITGGADRMAVLWDLRKGENLGRLTDHKGEIHGVALNRDGSKALTASEDKTAILWDVKTQNLKPLVTLTGHQRPVRAVAFSANGNHFATASQDGTAIVYLTATGKEIVRLKGRNEPLISVSFSTDGATLLTGSEEGNAVLWNWQDGEAIKLFTAKFKPLLDASFSFDGRRILTVDSKGMTIWKAEDSTAEEKP